MSNDAEKPDPGTELLKLSETLVSTIHMFTQKAAPYHKVRFALECKGILDHVLTTGEPAFLPVGELSMNTLRNKWYQAVRYLILELDPQEYYKKGAKLIAVNFKPEGVRIYPAQYLGSYLTQAWQVTLKDFLATAKIKDRYERKGIAVPDEAANEIKNTIDKDRFLYKIDRHSILVICTK